MPLDLVVPVTAANFDEARYLAVNADARAAIASGRLGSGREHFSRFGGPGGRLMAYANPDLPRARADKITRLQPFLRTDMACTWDEGRADFLTPELRANARIAATEAVSSNGYDPTALDLIARHADGLVLDCGAGYRSTYYENVVNYEIVAYPSTDVLGVGEALPFRDGSFDAVLSIAVLEHVRDPFACAAEIARVLKPGGRLYCGMPFLQPYHGYPHHYFNATPQGVRRLFEDHLVVEDVRVIDSMHPVWALHWILAVWAEALPPETRKAFRKMTVADLMRAPMEQVGQPFCRHLPPDKQLELACATVLTAHKPEI
ncbi:class I SAM-dependent methyltransferase [Methylobacterium trifolii]|uniref:Ubiquinone biosynthesis O-methyltransferase, mitochondrial n=1 Tax=Methylobacterium trifolii TaxID=1003092 RepID=A0ABQ4TU81_9HYPH|nr:class I SAM-dependent methyltransferase [Methylobacterium trifolii]GJE58843.1 Ubiquinone biosynthesis O-methyltransferase, mitochondrial [Methylobacterium trifolii]